MSIRVALVLLSALACDALALKFSANNWQPQAEALIQDTDEELVNDYLLHQHRKSASTEFSRRSVQASATRLALMKEKLSYTKEPRKDPKPKKNIFVFTHHKSGTVLGIN